MKKLFLTALLAIGLCSVGYSQTSTNPPPTVQNTFSTLFGLLNPNMDSYTNSIDFEFKTGLSYSSKGQSGLQQEFEPSIWYKIGKNATLGAGLNVDMLGDNSSDSALDAFGAHGYLGYTKYNLKGYIGAGGIRNMDLEKTYFEVCFGVEAMITDNAGLFASYNIGISGTKRDDILGRIVAGAQFKF